MPKKKRAHQNAGSKSQQISEERTVLKDRNEQPVEKGKAMSNLVQKPLENSDRKDSGVFLNGSSPNENRQDTSLDSLGEELGGLNLSSGIAAAKPAPGKQAIGVVTLRTNIYPIDIPPHTALYRYDVQMQEKSGARMVDLTKSCENDYFRIKSRERAYVVCVEVISSNMNFFANEPFAVSYDRRSQLYSLNRLPIKPGESKTFTVRVPENSTESGGSEDTVECRMTLTPTDPEWILLSDFSDLMTRDLEQRTRGPTQALEIVTNQLLYYRGADVQFGGKFYSKLAKDRADLGGGKELAKGVQKGVHLINDNGDIKMAMMLDSKCRAFFKPQALILTMLEILGFRENQLTEKLSLGKEQIRLFSRNVKGIVVHVRMNGRQKDCEVYGISAHMADEISVPIEDKRVADREVSLLSSLKIKIRYPRLPCVIERKFVGKGADRSEIFNYYPLELCRVAENQRVPLEKQTPNEMQQTIKHSAVKPTERMQRIEEVAASLVAESNKHVADLGLRMPREPLKVQGRVLPPPAIQFANNRRNNSTVPVDKSGNWDPRGQRFLEGGQCSKWAAICTDARIPKDVLIGFLERFQQKSAEMGIRLGTLVEKCNASMEQLEGTFKNLRAKGVEFAICFFFDKNQTLKDWIKFMELEHILLTQCVSAKVANDVTYGKGQTTLMNFVAKTNLKLGGLNYKLQIPTSFCNVEKWFSSGRTMFIGCDVNHPPPQPVKERRLGIPPKEPSVVGFTCNTSKEPLLFTGDYCFQDPRLEKVVKSMRQLTIDSVQRWRQGGTNLPASIIYFRDGIDEGQYLKVLQEEVPSMMMGLRDVGGPTYNPLLTVVIVVKRHCFRSVSDERLDPRSKASEQDFRVGTCIDTLEPILWIFYLKSHLAIQGTAKASKYAVMRDDNGFSQDELETVCYALAHDHQIVMKTVSLPAPVYGAHELAERGKRIWRAYSSRDANSESSSGLGSGGSNEPLVNYEQLTQELKMGSKFSDRKFWA